MKSRLYSRVCCDHDLCLETVLFMRARSFMNCSVGSCEGSVSNTDLDGEQDALKLRKGLWKESKPLNCRRYLDCVVWKFQLWAMSEVIWFGIRITRCEQMRSLWGLWKFWRWKIHWGAKRSHLDDVQEEGFLGARLVICVNKLVTSCKDLVIFLIISSVISLHASSQVSDISKGQVLWPSELVILVAAMQSIMAIVQPCNSAPGAVAYEILWWDLGELPSKVENIACAQRYHEDDMESLKWNYQEFASLALIIWDHNLRKSTLFCTLLESKEYHAWSATTLGKGIYVNSSGKTV